MNWPSTTFSSDMTKPISYFSAFYPAIDQKLYNTDFSNQFDIQLRVSEANWFWEN